MSVTLVEDLKRTLERVPGIRLAVLFGSTARGRARRDSDLDIGISASEEAIASSIQVALERATGRPVSITLLSDAPPLLRFEISRDGVVLIEREPGGWARFRARAMIDWWDWAETSRMMHRTMAQRLREEANRGPA